jgi:hypothetical protein
MSTTLILAVPWGSWVLHINRFCALHTNACCTSISTPNCIPEGALPQPCSGRNPPVHGCKTFGQLLRAAPAAEATKGGEPLVYMATPRLSNNTKSTNSLAHCSACALWGASSATRACDEYTNNAPKFSIVSRYSRHAPHTTVVRSSLLVQPAEGPPDEMHEFLGSTIVYHRALCLLWQQIPPYLGAMLVPAGSAIVRRRRLPICGGMVGASISQRPGLGTPAARSSGSGPSGVDRRRHAAAWHMDTV